MVAAVASAHPSPPLGIEPKTVFVTGKGGVGKSTVAAALALAYRDRGVRTLLVEISGQASAAALISTRKIGYEPVSLGGHLHAMRIDAESALADYARLRLRVRAVADRMVRNPIFSQFTQVAPGLRELLVLGKLWWLAQQPGPRGRGKQWEAIIVDAPATGHGLALLGMAGVVVRAFPVGPIATEARRVDDYVQDSAQTTAVLVALPEEIPVAETIEMHQGLSEAGIDVGAVVINAVLDDRLRGDQVTELDVLAEREDLPDDLVAAVEQARTEHERVADQQDEVGRILDEIGDVTQLPFLYGARITRAEIQRLAGLL